MEKYGTAIQATDDNTIRRMRFACWITKATDTQSHYAILIDFPRQQRLRERASMLRYIYIGFPGRKATGRSRIAGVKKRRATSPFVQMPSWSVA